MNHRCDLKCAYPIISDSDRLASHGHLQCHNQSRFLFLQMSLCPWNPRVQKLLCALRAMAYETINKADQILWHHHQGNSIHACTHATKYMFLTIP